MIKGLAKKSVADLAVAGKRVFLRVDFNVPLDADGRITDDTRIRAHLPTIRYLLDKKARLILASHLGRPHGQVNPAMSLAPVAPRLEELLKHKVKFVEDCVGPKVQKAVDALGEGEILLLENLRFYIGEEKNDAEFAKQLAVICDVYVNDAFSASHRAHCSVAQLPKLVPDAAEGFLLEKEIFYLGKLLEAPDKPFVLVLGGAKVKDKIGIITNLLGKVDSIAIGGGMCFTFLKANGLEIGDSLLDESHLEAVTSIIDDAGAHGTKILLPVDIVVAPQAEDDAKAEVVSAENIPPGQKGLDIGPKTAELFASTVKNAATVFWNGPMGVFEKSPFAGGTMVVAKALAESEATTVVGGGETVSAIKKAGVAAKITHISTGGGASLEFLAGLTLPGIAALDDK